ncbi:MAG: hypothetical protein ACREBV_05950 [Candidatus Zixiibacteriota bacterium]
MNTRLQVEHPITEMITGVDLVVDQIKIAAGQELDPVLEKVAQRGHAIECRIYAEDADNKFLPSTGQILFYREPTGPGIRVDSGIMTGSDITIDYDPIMAKLVVHAPDRNAAISKMIDALNNFKIIGVKTSRQFMIDVLNHPEFVRGNVTTGFIDDHMSSRTNDRKILLSLAAAAASAFSQKNSKRSSPNGSKNGDALPSPWELLGNWTIGSSING